MSFAVAENYARKRAARGFTPLALSVGYLNKEIFAYCDSKMWYDLPTVQAGTPMTVKEIMRPAPVTGQALLIQTFRNLAVAAVTTGQLSN